MTKIITIILTMIVDEDLLDLEDRNVQGTYMEDRIIRRRQDDKRTL